MRRVWGRRKREENWFSMVSLLPQFLLIFQALFGAISCQSWDGVIVTESDLQALQALKHQLVDPNGVLSSWNDTGLGACSGGWIGIKCAQGQVIVIQLPWRSLSGSLTEKIGQFQALRKLSFHDNSIGGAIPASLGFLPNLRGVQLFNNKFSGTIPGSIGLCPLLQTLELGNNSLSGMIPESLVNSTKLIRLSLGDNYLSGPISVRLTQLPSLIFLSLENNNLSGAIPGSIGNLSGLETLGLSGNSFNGSLPGSLFSLKKLLLLNLSSNQFDGQIPSAIGKFSSLRTLDLSHNGFSGQIPGPVAELPNLEYLDVSYNKLSGPVPPNLSQKFNPSSFLGNALLCGYSSSSPCPPSQPPQPSPSLRTPPRPQRQSHPRKLTIKDIILIIAGILLIILLITCCILIFCLVRKRQIIKDSKAGLDRPGRQTPKGTRPSSGEVEASGGKLVHFDGHMGFTADDLLCATADVLGKSTYGTVYRATMENGDQVAVKRLREKITKGQKEFETYANELGDIKHQNLLALRASYFGPKGEKLLVFDYMPNGSLATFLHARVRDGPLNWPTRVKIVKDVTRGLHYLHKNVNMIHGNLTSSNVLLDEHVNAKIGDFGLARLMTEAANANVIATAGALGYRAPEVHKPKKATAKSDVYSLGVIMLELLTRKSPGEAIEGGLDLPQWVASVVKEEWTNEVFDVELLTDASAIGDELLLALKLALHCVDPTPAARPEAGQLLRQLEEIIGGEGMVSPVD